MLITNFSSYGSRSRTITSYVHSVHLVAMIQL